MSKHKGKRTEFVNIKNGPKSSLAENQQNGEDNNRYYLDVDPDLQTDIDIELPKDHRAISRATMSAKSRKTIQSGRQSETRENIVRSRGRPIKPHETEPFLSINTLPPEKSFVSEKSTVTSHAAPSRASKPAQQITDESRSLEAQLQRMTAYMSPYNQQTPVPPSPSVATGHIYTKNAQSAKGQRTSPCKTPRSRPGSKTEQPLATKPTGHMKTDKINQSEILGKHSPNLANLTEEKVDLNENASNSAEEKEKIDKSPNIKGENVDMNSSDQDIPESKKTKLSRPSTAPPASAHTLSGSSKKHRPGSEKSGLSSDRQMSRLNTGTLKSRASSAGSRSGAGSRAGHNMLGFRSRGRSRSGSRSRLRKVSAGRRSVPSRTGRITPANTPYHSPNKTFRAPNHHIKSPFKHAVNQPEPSPDGRQTPSMGMKERTALAAFHVHKMLAVAGEKDVHKVTGKLQKGKLKPLYPVNTEGPSIDKCRGIVSETRAYQPSPSRTLQRRVNLVNKIPNVHEYLYERPRTVESVHQTSVASSIDDFFHDEITNRSLPDEILYAQEPSTLAPENTFFQPDQLQSEILESSQMMGMYTNSTVFATEVGSRDPEVVADVTVSDHVQHELHQIDSAATVQVTKDIFTENRNNHSKVDTDQAETNDRQISVEEKARLGSPSKSVRFAEQKDKLTDSQNSKEMKQLVNENIAKQQRDEYNGEPRNHTDDVIDEDIDANVIETVSQKNKLNSKGSCKSEDVETVFRKDDDDNDDEEGKTKDDNIKNSYNCKMGNSTGNSNQTSESDNKENVSKNGKNSGQKRAMSASQTRCRSASGSRQSSRSRDQNNSQIRKTRPSSSRSTKSSSQGKHCSRFEQSKASIVHTQTLEASSVLHGETIATVLGPESPKRGRSRSASPSRSRDQTFQFFSHSAKPCFENVDEFSSLHGNSHRSKVKFILDGEEPEMETIFMEDEDDINVRPGKEITYDVLDTEIEMLRSAIQNALVNDNEVQAEENENVYDEFSDEEVESVDESDNDTVVLETDTMDSIRGDYSNLLDKYRQRCMDRSETYGAISTTLVTPRDTQSLTSGRSRSLGNEFNKKSDKRNNNSGEPSKDIKINEGEHPLNTTVLSDSGHGSVDNLSEFSRSSSQVRSDVPKLDLGGSTSDLGLGSGRSDATVSTRNMEENGAEEEGKTLLELVCDQLSPVEQQQKPKKRRELDEDVTNLKIVATTKSLSKNSKKKDSGAGVIQAPFPPVCFTINARPPKGFLYYFAYGPDMNPNRFSSYVQRSIQDRYWGLLFGFNLVFNKKGTSEEAGGFANLEFNPLRSVEGCIYKITPEELQVLDKCVGYPQHFEHLVLPVWLSNSFDPDSQGVAQYCVPALTYIAQNNWTETEKPLNCDYALSQCIKSADMVTMAYKNSLVAMATQHEVTASA